MDSAACDSTCFLDLFNLFRLKKTWLAHILCTFEAQLILRDSLMCLFDLLIRMEEKQWVQSTQLELEATHVSVLIKFFV